MSAPPSSVMLPLIPPLIVPNCALENPTFSARFHTREVIAAMKLRASQGDCFGNKITAAEFNKIAATFENAKTSRENIDRLQLPKSTDFPSLGAFRAYSEDLTDYFLCKSIFHEIWGRAAKKGNQDAQIPFCAARPQPFRYKYPFVQAAAVDPPIMQEQNVPPKMFSPVANTTAITASATQDAPKIDAVSAVATPQQRGANVPTITLAPIQLNNAEKKHCDAPGNLVDLASDKYNTVSAWLDGYPVNAIILHHPKAKIAALGMKKLNTGFVALNNFTKSANMDGKIRVIIQKVMPKQDARLPHMHITLWLLPNRKYEKNANVINQLFGILTGLRHWAHTPFDAILDDIDVFYNKHPELFVPYGAKGGVLAPGIYSALQLCAGKGNRAAPPLSDVPLTQPLAASSSSALANAVSAATPAANHFAPAVANCTPSAAAKPIANTIPSAAAIPPAAAPLGNHGPPVAPSSPLPENAAFQKFASDPHGVAAKMEREDTEMLKGVGTVFKKYMPHSRDSRELANHALALMVRAEVIPQSAYDSYLLVQPPSISKDNLPAKNPETRKRVRANDKTIIGDAAVENDAAVVGEAVDERRRKMPRR